jgi:hypothetical protein
MSRSLLAPVLVASVLGTVGVATAVAQQRADTGYRPEIAEPTYRTQGPGVLFDEAHDNFHTSTGRYLAFVRLLEADGCRVTPNIRRFTKKRLGRHDLLVIANAGTEGTGSAFDEREIDAVVEWVDRGGALLLIADHAPFGARAAALAERFGV